MTNTNAGPVLPELPAPLSVSWYEQHARRYGEICAEHVAGPLRERLDETERALMLSGMEAKALRERVAELQGRVRSVCQTLVGAVGADGPCNAEDAADLAAERIAELEAERDRLRAENESLRGLAKWASGRLLDAGDHESAQTVLDKIPDRTAPAPQPDEIARLRAENEAKDKSIADLRALVLAVDCSDYNGVTLSDVGGVNWFDAARAAGEEG